MKAGLCFVFIFYVIMNIMQCACAVSMPMAAGDALQDGIDRTRPGLFPLVDRCPIWRGREGHVGQRHKPIEAPVARAR